MKGGEEVGSSIAGCPPPSAPERKNFLMELFLASKMERENKQESEVVQSLLVIALAEWLSY